MSNTLIMIFGSEATEAFEATGTVTALDTGQIKQMTFATPGERDAYLQGCEDAIGYNTYTHGPFSMGHSKGGPKRKWTMEKLTAEARKYQSRQDFRKASHGAYQSAYKIGALDEICAHMPRPSKGDAE